MLLYIITCFLRELLPLFIFIIFTYFNPKIWGVF
nr:MAG TPA: hypothetical protein [Caudoviricetes sp.]